MRALSWALLGSLFVCLWPIVRPAWPRSTHALTPACGDDDNDDGHSKELEQRGLTKAPLSGAIAESDDESTIQDGLSLGAEAEASTRFIWRGIAASRGAVVQPSVWLSYADLTVLVWANVLLTDELPVPISVIGPSLTYTYTWKRLEIEPALSGTMETNSHDRLKNTGDVAITGRLHLGRVTFITVQSVDLIAQPGAYYGNLGLEVSHPFGPWQFKGSMSAGWATAAYNLLYFSANQASLDVVEAGIEGRTDLHLSMYLCVKANYSRLLNPALTILQAATLWNVGLTLGWEI